MNPSRMILAASLLFAFEGVTYAQTAIPQSQVVGGAPHSNAVYPYIPGGRQPRNTVEPKPLPLISIPTPPYVEYGLVKPPYPYWWSDGPNAYADLDNAGIDYGTLLSSNWSTDCAANQACMKEDAAVGFSVVAPKTGTFGISTQVSVEWFFNISAASWPWDSNSVKGQVNLYVQDVTTGDALLHAWDKLYDAQDTGYYWSNGWSQPNAYDPISRMYCIYNNPNYKDPAQSGTGSGQAFWGCSEDNSGEPVTNYFDNLQYPLQGTVPVVQGHNYLVWIWTSIDGHLGATGGAKDLILTNVGDTTYYFD